MIEEKCPIFKVEKQTTDILFEAIGYFLITMQWAVVIYKEFVMEGVFLAIVSTIISLIIWQLSKHPHLYNYPVKITQENAQRQYKNATHFMSVMVLFLATIFGVMIIGVTKFITLSQGSLLAIIILLSLMMIILLVFFIQKSFKLK